MCEGSPQPRLLLLPLLLLQGASLLLLHRWDSLSTFPLLCIRHGCGIMQWDLGYLKTRPSCFQPEWWQGRILHGSTYSLRSRLHCFAWGLQRGGQQLPWLALNASVCCLGGSVLLGCFCTGPSSKTACSGCYNQVMVEDVTETAHFARCFGHVPWQSRQSSARSLLSLTKEKISNLCSRTSWVLLFQLTFFWILNWEVCDVCVCS